MTPKTRSSATSVVTYTLLGITAVGCFMLPRSTVVAYVPEPMPIEPETIDLLGVVRDFKQAHVDFDSVPSEGLGHAAGNVAKTLGSDQKPVFNAGGDENGPFENRVAHWKFDEGAGTIANDEMGSNHGTVINGATWNAGRVGEALRFDGIDDYVNVPSSPEMQISGDATFTGWFKLDEAFTSTSPDTLVIMEKFLDTEHDFHIGLAGMDYNRPEVPKGTMVFKVENGPTSDYYCYVWTLQQNWQPGVWYHFACVLDATNTANNKIFIDGIDNTDSTIAAGVGFLDTSYDAPMRIGGKTIDYNAMATDIYFKGMIDDVIIFDRALADGDFGYVPGGFRVTSQWYDQSGHKIAPHLYSGSDGDDTIYLVNAPTLSNDPTFDTYDSAAGPYGGANIGPAPNVVTGATMPSITVPSGLPFMGNLTYDGNTTSSLSSSVWCNNFRVVNQHTLQISGHVQIVVDNLFEVYNQAQIELLPGARLEIYSLGTTIIDNNTALNANTGDPSLFSLYHIGTWPFTMENSSELYAYVWVPDGDLVMQNTVDLYGRFVGNSITIANPAGYHHDGLPSSTFDACGDLLADVSGAAGAKSDAAISSAGSFDQWFRNVLGENLGGPHTLTLTKVNGVYEYIDHEFHPIDGKMLGNEGMAHNFFLSFATQASFTYNACTGQFIEFAGGDGAWIFIDGQLGIDLGGVLSGTEQRLDVDRLGLVDGETYDMHLFYAQRHPLSSTFHLRTNIDFASLGSVAVSGGWD